MSEPMDIVIVGLTITSSWGNGHATTYRALVRELCEQGHRVLFLERDKPWYRENRDLLTPPWGRTELYESLEELRDTYGANLRQADAVILGSYVPEGALAAQWVLGEARGVRAFYDIDTPVTLANLARGGTDYLTAAQIGQYDLYLSFTGGPTLELIERRYGSPCARPLYCSVDPSAYYPEPTERLWDLGYLGTYAEDRQPVLESLLNTPARACPERRFIVAGPMYPSGIEWAENVDRIDHLPPSEHRSFYNRQRFTLNATRAEMVRLGYSPSVRLFEAAACGTPIISDPWEGLDSVFTPGEEILVARSPEECLGHLRDMSDTARQAVGERGRQRVLAEHTATHRAAELIAHLQEAARLRRSAGTAAL